MPARARRRNETSQKNFAFCFSHAQRSAHHGGRGGKARVEKEPSRVKNLLSEFNSAPGPHLIPACFSRFWFPSVSSASSVVGVCLSHRFVTRTPAAKCDKAKKEAANPPPLLASTIVFIHRTGRTPSRNHPCGCP